MPITRVFILITLILLQGCVFTQFKAPSSVYIASGVKLNFISLKSLDSHQTMNQLLKGRYQNKNYNLNLVTQFSPDKMKTVALTKFGAQIFAISYDNKNLESVVTPFTKEAKQIRPEYIFADIQLIYWPAYAIKQNLIGNITIEEYKSKGFKRIFHKNGKPIIEIEYSHKNKWHSIIHFTHLERKYEYSIENL